MSKTLRSTQPLARSSKSPSDQEDFQPPKIRRNPENLTMISSPDYYEEEDYPDACYWTKSEWVKHENKQNDRGTTSTSAEKLEFLTNENGVAANKERLRQISKAAKITWNELYRYRLDPTTWSKTTVKAATYFSNNMRTQFEEFRLCEGDWKVEAFATIRFPDWCKNRDKGHLTRTSYANCSIYYLLHHCQARFPPFK